MTPLNEQETVKLVIKGLSALENLDVRTRSDIIEGNGWKKYFYETKIEFLERLEDYFQWVQGNKDENPGELMEEIALLLFKGFSGVDSFRSFQSYAPQHDLVVEGSSIVWQTMIMYLHLNRDGRTIIVEAKNQDTKISDQQLSRLCSILQNKFQSTADLGVFISRTSASGFPEPNEDNPRERSLRDARATQALFHSLTNKYVVVIDSNDLHNIYQGVDFPKILEAKIREVEAMSGIELTFNEDWNQIDLPPHLSKYF